MSTCVPSCSIDVSYFFTPSRYGVKDAQADRRRVHARFAPFVYPASGREATRGACVRCCAKCPSVPYTLPPILPPLPPVDRLNPPPPAPPSAHTTGNDGKGAAGPSHHKKKKGAHLDNPARRLSTTDHGSPIGTTSEYALEIREAVRSKHLEHRQQQQQGQQLTLQSGGPQLLSSQSVPPHSQLSLERRRLQEGNTEAATSEGKPKKKDHPSACRWDKFKVRFNLYFSM